jgi:predicted Kef-type K+ transport protein
MSTNHLAKIAISLLVFSVGLHLVARGLRGIR